MAVDVGMDVKGTSDDGSAPMEVVFRAIKG